MFQEFQMHNISLTENLNTEMEKPSEEVRFYMYKIYSYIIIAASSFPKKCHH
ncbi:hypothetical protein PGB90_009630 [Kerria lacca]